MKKVCEAILPETKKSNAEEAITQCFMKAVDLEKINIKELGEIIIKKR